MAWKKIACFTDIHWGKGRDDPAHNEMCLEFVQWFAENAEREGVDVVAFLGDWHDARNSIGVETLNYSKAGLDAIAAMSAPNKFFVIGNHDMYLRDTRRVDSLPNLDMYANIVAVRDPLMFEDVLFVPYIVPEDDLVAIARSGARYVFGHFELPGFVMDGSTVMTDRPGKLRGDDFEGPDHVFSGHFHKRQRQKGRGKTSVHYIGNCFPHDFGDAGDVSRGMMVLERGGEPRYIDWPAMPSYHRARPEAAVELVRSLGPLAPRARVQIVPDPSMTREERDAAVAATSAAGAARVTMVPPAKSLAASEAMEFVGVDVDASVVAWLSDAKNVDGLDTGMLVDIYRSAG